MYWKNDPNGSGYRIRQFDTPVNNSLRSLAVEELSAPKRRRPRRSLRLMLPSWLVGRANKDAEEMDKNVNLERKDSK